MLERRERRSALEMESERAEVEKSTRRALSARHSFDCLARHAAPLSHARTPPCAATRAQSITHSSHRDEFKMPALTALPGRSASVRR